ncbi:MAG: hypothetical protein RI573_07445 [Balneolaceae bacterium]|nr:hypothetical protein [Balneolaceae bacterium]
MKKYYLIAALFLLLISGFKTIHAQDGFFSNLPEHATLNFTKDPIL